MSYDVITRKRASALVFGGAALLSMNSGAGAQATTLRVAIVPTDVSAEVYYAKDIGLFAKAGIDANIAPMGTSPAIAAALASNAIDIGHITVDVLAAIHQKNIPLVAIAPASEYASPPEKMRTAALVLPASSPVHQAKELNGKIIAVVALNGLVHTASRAWIDQNGGDSSTVKFVEIPFPAMPAALEAGHVDAAFTVEPFLSAARKSGRVLVYGYDAISKHFILDAWCTTPQWANDHSDLVNRFAAVIHETAVWANKNPAKSGSILATYTRIDPAIIATMPRTHYAEQLTVALMQPLIDVSAKYNGFSTFSAQQLLYTPSR